MILIITNKKDYTADFLIVGLLEHNIPFFRLNTEDFPSHIQLHLSLSIDGINGYFLSKTRHIDLDSIRSAWYRRPVASNIPPAITDQGISNFIMAESRETLESLWKVMPWFWVSNPDTLWRAESKLYQLKLATDLGFTIPRTLVTTISESGHTFYKEHGNHIICKPQRLAYIDRDDTTGLIYTSVVKDENTPAFDNLSVCPTLFQPYIDKYLELRVTVVGTKVFAVALDSQCIPEAKNDWRRANARSIPHKAYLLDPQVAHQCVLLVQRLGLAFGAIDLILTPTNEIVFLEINPNGQWAWIQQMVPELDIRSAMIDLLTQRTNP